MPARAASLGQFAPPQARAAAAKPVRARGLVRAMGEGAERRGEIVIYGDIGEAYDWWTGEDVGNSPRNILDDIQAMGVVATCDVRIFSYGGDAFAGSAIYNQLRRLAEAGTRIVVTIDGIAASAASVIAMAADHLRMPANAQLMLHNPSTYGSGEATDFRRIADMLDVTASAMVQAYRRKNPSMSEEEVQAVLDAETWYTGTAAQAAGFVDELLDAVDVQARAAGGAVPTVMAAATFRNAPEAVAELLAGEPEATPADPVDPPVDDPVDPEVEAAAEAARVAAEAAEREAAALAAPAVDQALVEAVVAAVTARLAPTNPAPVPAPVPEADAARLAEIRAFAERRGVLDTFEDFRGQRASLDALSTAVNNAAAAKAARITSSVAPTAEAAPKGVPTPEETRARIAAQYQADNEWPIRRRPQTPKE